MRIPPQLPQTQPAVSVGVAEMPGHKSKRFLGFGRDLRAELSRRADDARPDIDANHVSLPVNRLTLPALRSA